MVGSRAAALVLVSTLAALLVALLGLQLVGDDPGSLWNDIAVPLTVFCGCLGLLALAVVALMVARVRQRARRDLARYQLVLSQADEAPTEEVAAACEQLVQTVRVSVTDRVTRGQAWIAIESWFVPSAEQGETGTSALMLVCEPPVALSALAALRHAYPDLALRADPERTDGTALRFAPPDWEPDHVLRVRKARSWAIPIAAPSKPDASNARSTMADIIRQQQRAGRLSCVRWCVMPSGEWLDSRAPEALARLGGRERPNAAASNSLQQALHSSGGAMSYLELQVGIEAQEVPDKEGTLRAESFSERQSAARRLLGPALSQRASNHLAERLMWARQRLYCRRWARAEPPLIPDARGCTLMAPRELAQLMELPSLGSEHALPLQRNTVPQLPVPVDVPRARHVDVPMPPADDAPSGDASDHSEQRRAPDAAAIDPNEPGIAIGCGLPNVPWTILQRDRIYGLFLAGGQNSGKSSKLLRVALNDIYAGNTATVVLDMKGTLSERLVRLTPPDVPKRWWDDQEACWHDGTKRVWYLDLRRPAFGLTPLQMEAGWTHTGLADDFARIADAITRALLDLYPGQIMGSSEDLIERAVVGTMAIAWWQHERRCDREGRDPTSHGFAGSFEVLAQMFAPSDKLDAGAGDGRGRRRVAPNRWHQAAGRACQKLPNLDQVAETLLFEIPRQARDNLGDIAKRMEAPANKIRPLVGAAASVRRFVGHPERLSLRSVIEAHDTLIVNPRIELIGEDQASILTNFIVHMLDMELKRQLSVPAPYRPWVSLIVDEGHRLVNETMIRMAATHREAHLTLAVAVQYVSQLGADAPTAARRERIIKGVGNLLQTKMLFRMSDTDDAEVHSQIFRAVYETMVRADPTSRARMPFDPSRLPTLRDFYALVSPVSGVDPDAANGLIDATAGATRRIGFADRSFRMHEIDEIQDTWRKVHLDRQAAVFSRYPEDMSVLADREVPPGLVGQAPPPAADAVASDAREVAEQTIGRIPEGALRKVMPASPTPTAADPEGASGVPQTPGAEAPTADRHRAVDQASVVASSSSEPAAAPDPVVVTPPPETGPDGAAAYSEQLFDPDGSGPGWERIGGVRIQRSEQPVTDVRQLADSRVLKVACQPTDRALPGSELAPATQPAYEAMREAASFDAISTLGDWVVAGDEARVAAKRAAQRAHEQSIAAGEGAGLDPTEIRHQAERRARKAAGDTLARFADQKWRVPVREVSLNDPDTHTLEVIARLKLAAPRLLGTLLTESAGERALRDRVAHLFDAGLIARSEATIAARRGRRPRLFAVAPRGLEYLRIRHAELRPDGDPPPYLQPTRQLPSPGKGSDVPHELAVQLVAVAFSQYDAGLHWHTTRMPGGRWDVGMIHHDRRDRTLLLGDLLPAPGLTVHGERLDAPALLEPDLSVQLQGTTRRGERAIIDALVEVDRTRRGSYNVSKFTAYDHFLGGWCLKTRRWGDQPQGRPGVHRGGRPLVVFVAMSAKQLLVLMHAADAAMTLGFGGAGRYDPATFEYPGRAHTVFTSLEWLLAGQALGMRLPSLPPSVRGADVDLRPERVAILPETWWPPQRH